MGAICQPATWCEKGAEKMAEAGCSKVGTDLGCLVLSRSFDSLRSLPRPAGAGRISPRGALFQGLRNASLLCPRALLAPFQRSLRAQHLSKASATLRCFALALCSRHSSARSALTHREDGSTFSRKGGSGRVCRQHPDVLLHHVSRIRSCTFSARPVRNETRPCRWSTGRC